MGFLVIYSPLLRQELGPHPDWDNQLDPYGARLLPALCVFFAVVAAVAARRRRPLEVATTASVAVLLGFLITFVPAYVRDSELHSPYVFLYVFAFGLQGIPSFVGTWVVAEISSRIGPAASRDDERPDSARESGRP